MLKRLSSRQRKLGRLKWLRCFYHGFDFRFWVKTTKSQTPPGMNRKLVGSRYYSCWLK